VKINVKELEQKVLEAKQALMNGLHKPQWRIEEHEAVIKVLTQIIEREKVTNDN
jgi:hypothetical protein